MSETYYRQNLDQYCYNNSSGTPRNAVLEVVFSDTSYTTPGASGESVLTYRATSEVYTFQDDRLIGATILLAFRDGLQYVPVDEFTMLHKEFIFDEEAGTITYPPDPFPPMQIGEDATVLFEASGGGVVVTEPVTLQQAKDWLKVEVDDDDNLIEPLITAAREFCEDFIGQSLVERTVTTRLRNDLGNIMLPYGPVGVIVAAEDMDGNTIASDAYTIDGVHTKNLRAPITNGGWVQFEYTAGYATCPDKFITAIKNRLAFLYFERGDRELAERYQYVCELTLKRYKIYT